MTRLICVLLALLFSLSGPAIGAYSDFDHFGIVANTGTTAIRPYFPANNGFLGATEKQFLMPAQTIDRFGGSGYSRFFSPAGTSEAARALPAGSATSFVRGNETFYS